VHARQALCHRATSQPLFCKFFKKIYFYLLVGLEFEGLCVCKEVLYHLSHISDLFCSVIVDMKSLELFTQVCLKHRSF
jgi:hypothetical protein